MTRLRRFGCVLGLTFGLSVPSTFADPITITFGSDTEGLKPNGFVSNESDQASFSATDGGNLRVLDFLEQSEGNALAASPDDPFSLDDVTRLSIAFTGYMEALEIGFGNDDPNYAHAGDRAWLQLYDGDSLVSTVFTAMNLNDHLDQSVAFSGKRFNNARFWFGNSTGTPIGLSEIVDNISFQQANAPVPEPATVVTLACGLAVFGARRWRQRKA